jgi:hypothetical protein
VEEVQALFEQWASLLSEPGRVNRWRIILNPDGSPNMDSEIVSWGLTGDKGGLDLYGTDDDADTAIPANSWFVQVMIENPTATEDLIADPKTFNGLAPLDAVVLSKADNPSDPAGQDDWGGPDPADSLEPSTYYPGPDLSSFEAPEPDTLENFAAPDPAPAPDAGSAGFGMPGIEDLLIDRQQALDHLGGRIGTTIVKKLEDAENEVTPADHRTGPGVSRTGPPRATGPDLRRLTGPRLERKTPTWRLAATPVWWYITSITSVLRAAWRNRGEVYL